jgi:hypothetical protein
LAPSADGATIWFQCRLTDKDNPVNGYTPGVVYALEISSARVTRLAQAKGSIHIIPAPIGGQVILAPDAARVKATLYDGTRKIANLPIGDYGPMAWGPNAAKIYFRAGSTIESDAWNILGILSLPGLGVARKKLQVPTESFFVCRATGHIFTGDSEEDGNGSLKADSVEYDADLNPVQRPPRHLPGHFSATCRYVATDVGFHGPEPWEIDDVVQGHQLIYYGFYEEDENQSKENYIFLSWNPVRDELLLRQLDPPKSQLPVMEVFDLSRRRVLVSLPDFEGKVAWSADGKSLIFSRRQSLVVHPVFTSGWASPK